MSSLTDKILDTISKNIVDLNNSNNKVSEPPIVDETGVDGISYVGYNAPFQQLTSAAVWKIKKITVTGTVTTIKYADGNTLYDNIWDNRASLTYLYI